MSGSTDTKCLKLVEPLGYTWEQLTQLLQKSTIKGNYELALKNKNIREICEKFLDNLNGELSLDDTVYYWVAACMVYMITKTTEQLSKRTLLFERAFQYSDTLNPVHIHYATKQILAHLKAPEMDDIGYMMNLLNLCKRMFIASETGKMIAICICWAIIAEVSGTQLDMNRIRPFVSMFEMLESLEWEILLKPESMPNVYVLVLAIGYLINAVAFGKTDVLHKAGYRDLEMSEREKKKLYAWCSTLLREFNQQSLAMDEYAMLRMQLTRYVSYNIIEILDVVDSISEAYGN